MLAKGKKTSNPDENSGESSRKSGMRNWYENNQRSIIAVALIAIVAFVLRFIFAFGTSVGSGTALSGGASASEHLHAIVAILDGGSFIGADGTLNYPFGSTNTNPVLYDIVLLPFALLGKALGMTSVAAASAALAWGAVVFGVLATIMAYFVGKEFLGEKKHGYLAAAFIAFCPIVITNTVFSNGSEIAFVSFLFMLMSFFLVRGTKNIESFSMPTDKFTDIFRLNKNAMKYAVISGIVLALIILSWNGFRSIANALCVIMAIMVLVDRFRKKDSRVIAVYFSIVLLIGMVAATAYYVPSGLWDAVLSGVLISSLLSVAVCLSYASLQKIPWTITIPVYAIVLIAVFVALFYLAPDYFNVIFNGNSVYAEKYGSLVSVTGLSLSAIATNYGFFTMWFPFIMIIMMLWRLPKNINSAAYVFTIIWVCFGVGYGIVSKELAVIYAPAYALGFAFVLAWIFDNVKFKDYFDAIRASDLRSVWKKLLKPIPFLTIIGVLLLICAPNALYAIDASIPSNSTDDMEGLDVGALTYYIKTDDDWKVNDVLSQYSSTSKDGAMLTWTEYANDASTFGGFSVTTDSSGNGARSTSLTLLANGTDGTAVADMMINLILYKGIDASKDTLIAAGMSEEVYSNVKKVIDNPGNYREEILKDTDKYGAFSSSISDESIIYAYCSNIITAAYDSYQIANIYEAMANATEKSIGYIMVTGDMIPISYGNSSTFAAMAKMGDYEMYDDYGTVSEFEATDSTSMYVTMYSTGVYTYTDSLTNSLLWRSYFGKSPAEYGFTGYYATSNYYNALALSDGTVKAEPGYGLANFEVDKSSWYVKYNPDSKATADSDGWVKMLAVDAQAKQEKDGGLINYLAGYPVILNYVSNSAGTKVSGTVTDYTGTEAVKGIRVSVVDESGVVRSTTTTDDNGKYNVAVVEGNTIEFRSASSNLNDGTLVYSVKYYNSYGDKFDVKIPETTIDFKLVDSDGKEISTVFDAKAKFVGKNSGFTATWDLSNTSHTATGKHLVPDTYDITVTDPSGLSSYATATYTVVPGVNTMYNIKVETTTVTISLVDDMGVTIGREYVDEVIMTETTYGTVFSADNKNGTVTIDALAGTYDFTIKKDGEMLLSNASVITVPTTTSVTVMWCDSTSPAFASAFDGKLTVVSTMGYQTSTTAGQYSMIPKGTADNAVFTMYAVDGSNVLLAKTNDTAVGTYEAVKVSGTLKDSSGNAVQGSIVFIVDIDGKRMQIPVSSDKDGNYSVMLPKDKTYTVYAQYSSEVSIEKNFSVTAEISDKTITTASATKVTGNVYWRSSSYDMINVPVTVTYDDVVYDLVTDSDGAYTMYIPADTKCTSIVANVGGTNFYFKVDSAESATSTLTDTTGGNFPDTVYVKDVSVKNSSGYKVELGSTTINDGDTATMSISSKTWSATVYDASGDKLLSSVSVPVSVRELTSDYFDIPEYTKITFSGLASTDSVSVTAIEDDDGNKGSYQKTGSDNSKYFFEKSRDKISGFSYLVTIKDTDSTKIAYAYLVLNSSDAAELSPITITLASKCTVSGNVGLSAEGTVKAVNAAVGKDGNPIDYSVDTTDGTYSMVLPVSSSGYVFNASVNVTDGNYKYNYVDTQSLSTVEADKEYVRNFAVTSNGVTDEGKVNAELTITSMVDSSILFDIKVNNLLTSKTTYLISAGTAWSELTFYDDAGTQISSVAVDGSSSTTIHGVGKIAFDKVGFGVDDLSVIIADINSETSCTSVFKATSENLAKWVKHGENKSTIQYGNDAVSTPEYKYAISITNSDNYTKTYTIYDVKATEGNLSDKWLLTYVCDKVICSGDSSTGLTVLGYQTATMYVKITAKESSSEAVPSITFKVKSETDGESFEIGDNTEGGMTKEGNVVTVKSVEQKSLVTVTGMSADGRGVFNEYGETQAYVWVLFGVAIVLVMLVIWLGLKRGVFSRKK